MTLLLLHTGCHANNNTILTTSGFPHKKYTCHNSGSGCKKGSRKCISCLFYFYRGIAGKIFILIWIGAGLLTFIIGKPGWHIGASGLIYGLAFFLFFSGILRKYVPLIAISLLVTFLYGGIIWHMFPYFSPANMSWEGHLSGGIMGTLCALAFVNHGPQRPEPFADEKDDDEEEEENPKEEFSNQDLCNASINNVIFAVNNLTEIANRIIPKNLRII